MACLRTPRFFATSFLSLTSYFIAPPTPPPPHPSSALSALPLRGPTFCHPLRKDQMSDDSASWEGTAVRPGAGPGLPPEETHEPLHLVKPCRCRAKPLGPRSDLIGQHGEILQGQPRTPARLLGSRPVCPWPCWCRSYHSHQHCHPRACIASVGRPHGQETQPEADGVVSVGLRTKATERSQRFI